MLGREPPPVHCTGVESDDSRRSLLGLLVIRATPIRGLWTSVFAALGGVRLPRC
jgi:hypothetical protein